MHIMPHTEESKQKMSETHKGIPNFSRRRKTIEENGIILYQTDYEKMLLRQLFYKIVPDWSSKTYYYRTGKGSRSIYGITCIKAQAIQIGIEFDFYKELWKEEVDFFFSCFIQKHEIFGICTNGDSKEMVPEELWRMKQIMSGMQDKSMVKRIEGGRK